MGGGVSQTFFVLYFGQKICLQTFCLISSCMYIVYIHTVDTPSWSVQTELENEEEYTAKLLLEQCM